jgi:nicotinamide mononucleotide (NMN) deamidase PncC
MAKGTKAAGNSTVGISHSAMAGQKLKHDMRAGTYVINEAKCKNFEEECHLADTMAKFKYEGEKWKVFHLRCGR